MEFDLTPEQVAFRQTAGRFGRERLAPFYKQRELDEAIDPGLIRDMGSLGLLGCEHPEEFGGLGLDAVTVGVVIEETAYHDFNVAYIQLLASLLGSILWRHAPPELAREVVSKICAGEEVCAIGLTEPGSGSDAANLRMKAEKDGNDYILNGEKTSISYAVFADHAVTFARTGTVEEKAKGITAFFTPLDLPGITTTRFDDVGTKAVGRGSIFYDNVRIPGAYRLGEEGMGFIHVMQGFDYSRALIALQCIAPAQASLDESWQYVTERNAMGKPLAQYQGVTQPLAEGETLLHAARLLCYKTLWLRDQGRPHTSEAAQVKWLAPKVAFDVIHDCLLTFGHMGYSTDMPHQQRLRDVMGLQIGDGTAQVQKMIVARERIGRVAVPY